ncbi:MAG: protein phosphatase 2C domain-containing protein [Filomicrobium sp.]
MPFQIIDQFSLASGSENEDQTGHNGIMAWVIDGATDMVDEPLVGKHSDAAWIANEAQNLLEQMDIEAAAADLSHLPQQLNEELAKFFQLQCRRTPQHRWEHPSATALIVRLGGQVMDWVSVGDCALIAQTPTGLHSVGIGGPDAGDRSVIGDLKQLNAANQNMGDNGRKSQMWPTLREKRGARLNREDGYAVLSITPPPPNLIGHGRIEVKPGSHVLLATDGLTRLIEVFSRYTPQELLDAAIAHGLETLCKELRELETQDGDCLKHPRIKRSDDATGLLLRAT